MSNEDVELVKLQLQESLEDSEMVWWDWEIGANRVTYSEKKVTMLGYDPEDFREVGYEAFTNLIHPEDHERAMEAMRRYLSGKAPIYQIDYRIRRADKNYTWYMDRGYATEVNRDGSPLVLRGLVFDLGTDYETAHHDASAVAAIREALPRVEGSDSAVERKLATVCSVCLRLKLPDGTWTRVSERLPESFLGQISHGICPTCISKIYPEYARAKGEK